VEVAFNKLSRIVNLNNAVSYPPALIKKKSTICKNYKPDENFESALYAKRHLQGIKIIQPQSEFAKREKNGIKAEERTT